MIARLKHISGAIAEEGRKWAEESVDDLDATYRGHLATQGRGGAPPPLSQITRDLYSQLGDPDGSGIRNHIRTGTAVEGASTTAYLGILDGKPTMVAKVQDRGATIPVTEKMRGFLAAHGIFLRATTTHIVIPPRRSWSDSIHAVRGRAKKRLNRLWVELWRSGAP